MIPAAEAAVVARLLLRGSALDAYAAHASGWLADRLPAFEAELRSNQEDERRHAAIQAELAVRLDPECRPDGQARLLFASWRAWEAPGRLLMLHLVERIAMLSFEVLGRRLRQLGALDEALAVLDIARDERRHVRTGRDALLAIGPVPAAAGVYQAIRSVYAADPLLEVEAPRVLGIGRLTELGDRVWARWQNARAGSLGDHGGP